MKTVDGNDGSGFTENYTDIDVFDLTLDPLLNDCDMINVFFALTNPVNIDADVRTVSSKRMLMEPTAQIAMNVMVNWWQ